MPIQQLRVIVLGSGLPTLINRESNIASQGAMLEAQLASLTDQALRERVWTLVIPTILRRLKLGDLELKYKVSFLSLLS